MPPEEAPGAVAFKGVNPIFRVQDISASIDYYVDKLGFKRNWQTPFFASVYRGGCNIFLSQGDQGHLGSWIWVSVGDVDALLNEYQSRQVKIRHPPTNFEFTYEMQVEDLDGNILRLGAEPKPDQPIGEWLDMNGNRWTMTAPNQWSRAPEL
jgi:catechol 2,3-dioxygenase-like lactoylglutathione lyase family enzyme